MKKTFVCVFLLFLIYPALNSYGQFKAPSLQGIVNNESASPAEAATVKLLHYPDSSFVQSTATNKNGVYQFSAVKAGQYLVLITKTGYNMVYAGPYEIINGKTVEAAPVKLNNKAITLGEVIILEKRRYIDVRADKTVLNLDRNILATGTSVLNVLSSAPGVKVNGSGDVSLNAGQRAAILVNGKPVKLQGEDLATFLQNLQTTGVQQIELIRNPSAKFDAEGTGGVINIILKRGNNVGFNGSVLANAQYGSFGKGGTSFTGNYRTQKVNIYGSAGFDYAKNYRRFSTLRNVTLTDVTTFDSRYYSTQSTPKFSYRLGTDFFIDSAHTIGFLVLGSNSMARYHKQTDTYMYLNNNPDSAFNTGSNLKRNIDNMSYNINYSGNLGHTKQTLSADLDLAVYNRHSYEDIVSIGKDISQTHKSVLPVRYNNDTLSSVAPTNIKNQSARVDYINPISKNSSLEAGLKASYLTSKNSQYFNVLQNGVYLPDQILTSQFNYTEKLGAAYVNYIVKGNKIDYTAGLRYERTQSDAENPSTGYNLERNYSNLFPSLQIAYHLSNAQLTLDYSRRIQPVDYSTLNPIIAYQDTYNYTKGNEYLKPAYSNTIQLSYLKNSFMMALYSTLVSDFYNFNYFSQNDTTKVLTSTKINLKVANTFGVKLNLPLTFTKWWNINLYSDISYQRYKSYDGLLNKGTKDLIFNLNQDFTITKTISAVIQSQYESSTFYGISYLRPAYTTTVGISKQFSRAATLTLNVRDIFNTDRDRYTTNFANLDITGYHKEESQIIRLSFVYRFGKNGIKAARKHTTGNSEELKRMSSGGN